MKDYCEYYKEAAYEVHLDNSDLKYLLDENNVEICFKAWDEVSLTGAGRFWPKVTLDKYNVVKLH